MKVDMRAAEGRRSFLGSVGVITMCGVLGAATSNSLPASERGTRAPAMLVFDVAGTLLDVGYLSPMFRRVFGDEKVAVEWFGQLILYSMSATVTGSFRPFAELGGGVLTMLGRIHKVTVKPSDLDELKLLLANLPVYPDVGDGLRALKDAGFRLVTLTDSEVPSAESGPLVKAGLDGLFERHFSAESVRRFKPATTAYEMVSQQMRTPPTSMCMVAAHPWDLIGAQKAGCMGALITRPGVAPFRFPESAQPQVVAPTLTAVAGALIRLRHA